MSTRTAALVIGFAASLAAQGISKPDGAYRFVHLSFSDGEKPEPTSQGGMLSFDAVGAAQWGGLNARYEVTGPFEALLSAEGVKLALRYNQDASVLVGSAAGEPGARHHLLVAVRAAENLSPMTLRGTYGMGAMTFREGATSGLATAYGQLTASGMGQFTPAVLIGHAAGIDDVSRREERTGLTYELSSEGTGIAHFGAGSDVLNGDMRIAVSADGAIVLGWPADPAQPGLLIGVRKTPDAATFSFRGRFWFAELMAENSFVFQQSTRFSSATGSLASNSINAAYVSQQLLSGGESSYLATVNQYRVGTDGVHSLGPRLEAGVNNFAFNETAFIAVQVGPAGQLALTHGLAFGVAAPFAVPALSNAASPLTAGAPIVPGALMSLSGSFGGDVKIRVNGVDAQSGGAPAPDRIQFQVPPSFEGESATVEVMVGGKVAQTLHARRVASSPFLFTTDGTGAWVAASAAPGETVTLTATGLGAAPTLRVLFDGQPGEVASTTPIDGQPGRHLIKVVVPRDINVAAGASREVPVVLATPESFVDLADVLVSRPAVAN